MDNNNLPLDYLAAFSLAFVVGALCSFGLNKYIDKVKNQPTPECKNTGAIPH